MLKSYYRCLIAFLNPSVYTIIPPISFWFPLFLEEYLRDNVLTCPFPYKHPWHFFWVSKNINDNRDGEYYYPYFHTSVSMLKSSLSFCRLESSQLFSLSISSKLSTLFSNSLKRSIVFRAVDNFFSFSPA